MRCVCCNKLLTIYESRWLPKLEKHEDMCGKCIQKMRVVEDDSITIKSSDIGDIEHDYIKRD